jgi:hypothetical protein
VRVRVSGGVVWCDDGWECASAGDESEWVVSKRIKWTGNREEIERNRTEGKKDTVTLQ